MTIEKSNTSQLIDGLINQIPSKRKTCRNLSLVIEPNSFKKYYQLLGTLLFLKQMENQDKIKIKRISACIFSSVYAIYYILDNLQILNKLHSYFDNKSCENEYMFHEASYYTILIDFIKNNIPDDAYVKLTDKLYLSYYDTKWKKKITKHTFVSNEHLMNIIQKSLFIPFSNGKALYKNRYIACEYSYSFEKCKHPIINIQSYSISNLFTNNHEFGQTEKQCVKQLRIGIVDAYSFFTTESTTETMSFTNTYLSKDIWQVEIKKIVEQISLLVLSIFIQLLFEMKRRIREKIEIYKSICSPMKERSKKIVKKDVKSRKKDKYNFRMGMGVNVCGLPMTICSVCA